MVYTPASFVATETFNSAMKTLASDRGCPASLNTLPVITAVCCPSATAGPNRASASPVTSAGIGWNRALPFISFSLALVEDCAAAALHTTNPDRTPRWADRSGT